MNKLSTLIAAMAVTALHPLCGSAQSGIDISTPAKARVTLYDSLSNSLPPTAIRYIIGQTLIVLPFDTAVAPWGYGGFLTQAVTADSLDQPGDEVLGYTAKNPRIIYASDPRRRFASRYSALVGRHFLVEDISTTRSTEYDGLEFTYLHLRDGRERLFYLCQADDILGLMFTSGNGGDEVMIAGYLYKRRAMLANQRLTVRATTVLADYNTGIPVTLQEGEEGVCTDVVISPVAGMVHDLCALVRFGERTVGVPPDVFDWKAARPPARWRKMFLPTNVRQQLQIAPERWPAVLAGKPQLGMTKREVMAMLGLPSDALFGTTADPIKSALADDDWDYPTYTQIEFKNGVVSKVWNFEQADD